MHINMCKQFLGEPPCLQHTYHCSWLEAIAKGLLHREHTVAEAVIGKGEIDANIGCCVF